MNSDSQAQFLSSRPRKTPRREMSQQHNHQSRPAWRQFGESSSSSATAPRHSHHHHHHHHRHPPPSHPHPLSLPTPPTRFQRDGLDFRRPVMSTATSPPPPSTPPPAPRTEDVIDLTNEPDSPPSQSHNVYRRRFHRPPRFGRNIMADVVDLEDEHEDQTINLDPSSSPEVEFVQARMRNNGGSNNNHNNTRRGPPPPSSRLLDLINSHRNTQSGFMTQEVFRDEIALRSRQLGRRRGIQPSLEEFFFADSFHPNIDLTIDLGFQSPGFAMSEPTPTEDASYKAPSPAPEGFTRTVTDEDVVVCVNCDHELGTGDDLARQVWAVKQCGHVYCGECTHYRSKQRRTGQSPPDRCKPFSKCKVDGCEKLVSAPKSMIQIFL